MRSLSERFWSKVTRTDSCWLWCGAIGGSNGYGQFWCDGRTQQAHRVAWFFEHGVHPASDLFVCHRCDVPACVNPAHLFLGTNSANQLDAYNKGRSRPHIENLIVLRTAASRAMVACKRGHPRGGENTLLRKDGRWECLPCKRMRDSGRADYYRQWRAAR